MRQKFITLLFISTLLFFSSSAIAHSGNVMIGFLDGIIHPVIGLDHLIAMIIEADQRPKYRVTTRPGRAAKMRRTDSKVKRGNVKKLRSKKISHER